MIVALCLSCMCISASAANGMKAVGTSVELNGTEAGSATVSISASSTIDIALFQGTWSVSELEGSGEYFKLKEISSSKFVFGANDNDANVTTGAMIWVDPNYAWVTFDADAQILTATYEVAANTPAGDYTVEFIGEAIGDADWNDLTENFTFTITVTEAASEPTCNHENTELVPKGNGHLTHNVVCLNPECGAIVEEKVPCTVDPSKTTYNENPSATCCVAGEQWKTTYCACGSIIAVTYDKIIPATGEHTLEKIDKKAPTCNFSGHKEYWQCAKWGYCYEDEAGTIKIEYLSAWLGKGGDGYLPVEPDNHGVDYGFHYDSNGSTHTKYCNDCDVAIEGEIDVPCSGGKKFCDEYAVCEVCGWEYGEIFDHSGGTATCVSGKICEKCEYEYTEPTEEHTGEQIVKPIDDRYHAILCSECKKPWASDEESIYVLHKAEENGYCECGVFAFVLDFNGGHFSQTSPDPDEVPDEKWKEMVEDMFGSLHATAITYFYSEAFDYPVEPEELAFWNLMVVREGYKLVGYAYNKEGTQPYNGDVITGPTTLYLVWESTHTCTHDHYDITATSHQSICSCGKAIGEAEAHDYTTGGIDHTCACGADETFTVIFHFNGGVMDPDIKEDMEEHGYVFTDTSVKMYFTYGGLDCNLYVHGLTRDGYTLSGFIDGDGKTYNVGEFCTITSDMEFTAQWELHVCEHYQYNPTDTTHQSVCKCGKTIGEAEVHDQDKVYFPGNCRSPVIYGCSVCGKNQTGAVNPEIHTGTIAYDKTATHHTAYYSCCGKVIEENVPHKENVQSSSAGNCSSPSYTTYLCPCGQSQTVTGDVNPNVHSANDVAYKDRTTTHHTAYHPCCQKTIETVEHDYNYDYDSANSKCICGVLLKYFVVTMNFNGGNDGENFDSTEYPIGFDSKNLKWAREKLEEWSGKIIREGYTFKGWTYVKDDPSTLIDIDTFDVTADVTTVYALWEKHVCVHDHYDFTDTTHQSICSCGEAIGEAEAHSYNAATSQCICGKWKSYLVTMDFNGGIGGTNNTYTEYSFNFTKLNLAWVRDVLEDWCTDIMREGYTFKGWTSVKDDASTLIDIATFDVTADVTTVYALWEEGHTCGADNLTRVPAVEANCKQGGNIEYWTCECGKWYSDSTATTEITDKNSVNTPINENNHAADGAAGVQNNGDGTHTLTRPCGHVIVTEPHNYNEFGHCICGVNSGWYYVGYDWYYYNPVNNQKVTGLTRVPYNAKLDHAANPEDLAYNPDFKDASEAWYLFDEDGKLVRTTGIVDNKYYADGVQVWHPGFVTVGGELYYFVGDAENGGNKPADGLVYATRGGAEGKYEFDNGILVENVGVVEIEGILYYFDADHKLAMGAGLVKIGDKYIYVRSNGMLAIGQYYLPVGLKLASKMYQIDENGYLLDPVSSDKNGIYDGYYYVNGKITYAGLIEIDGEIYYVKSNGQVATGKYYVTKISEELKDKYTAGDKLYFGEDGKLLKTGIYKNADNTLSYYVDGRIQIGAGVVEIEDGVYIYVKSNGTLATGEYWPTKTNGYLERGKYDWGTDGKYIAD